MHGLWYSVSSPHCFIGIVWLPQIRTCRSQLYFIMFSGRKGQVVSWGCVTRIRPCHWQSWHQKPRVRASAPATSVSSLPCFPQVLKKLHLNLWRTPSLPVFCKAALCLTGAPGCAFLEQWHSRHSFTQGTSHCWEFTFFGSQVWAVHSGATGIGHWAYRQNSETLRLDHFTYGTKIPSSLSWGQCGCVIVSGR